uniref:Uncharacterized protein n=1 Tax=Leersia perrieri TaxID=77586 RepID=A0A0D9WPP9_9ORYZ
MPLLASNFDHVSQILHNEEECCCLSPHAINRLNELLQQNPSDELPKESSILTKQIISMNEKLHVLYLGAISRLPTDALRIRYHRSLIQAGHCFSPARDPNPISNIILNTIWYDTAFPPHVELKLDMISTMGLARIDCRSLNGLLAFLCKIYPHMSQYDAMLHLLRGNSSLVDLDKIKESSCSYKEACEAAAKAARHPHPVEQVEFVVSTCHPLLNMFDSFGVQLTSNELSLISHYFSHKSYPEKPATSVVKLTPGAAAIVSHSHQKFMAIQHFICKKVKAALKRYAAIKGARYKLHIICGVNLDVPENGKHGCFWNHQGYPYAHILMTQLPSFFSTSNSEEDLDGSLLCSIVQNSPAISGRCFHCEYEGTKIVHPAFETYHGRESDFEEMACGRRDVDNEELIAFGKLGSEHMGVLHDDSVYFDPARDSDFVKWMNWLDKDEGEAWPSKLESLCTNIIMAS